MKNNEFEVFEIFEIKKKMAIEKMHKYKTRKEMNQTGADPGSLRWLQQHFPEIPDAYFPISPRDNQKFKRLLRIERTKNGNNKKTTDISLNNQRKVAGMIITKQTFAVVKAEGDQIESLLCAECAQKIGAQNLAGHETVESSQELVDQYDILSATCNKCNVSLVD